MQLESQTKPSHKPISLLLLEYRNVFLLGTILLIALGLRLFHLGYYSFVGDEYNSLREATHPLQNPHALSYWGPMYFWMWMGTSEIWLRLPSVLFGTVTCYVLYLLFKLRNQHKTGLFAALLLAVSPLHIYHSQSFRFYALWTLMATLTFYLASLYIQRPAFSHRISAVAASLACLVSHFFGIINVATAWIGVNWDKSSFRRTANWIIAAGVMIVVLVLMYPPIHRNILMTIAVFQGGVSGLNELRPRGLEIISFFKVGQVFLQFIWGPRVYPGSYVVLAGTIFWIALLFIPIPRASRGIFLTHLWVPIIVVYLICDSLIPSVYPGASPRYVLPSIVGFYALIALGISAIQKPILKVAILLIIILCQIYSLKEHYFGTYYADWSERVPWRHIFRTTQAQEKEGEVIIVDGRSQDPAEYYYDGRNPVVSFWDMTKATEKGQLPHQLGDTKGLWYVFNNYKVELMPLYDRFLKVVQKEYSSSPVIIAPPGELIHFVRRSMPGYTVSDRGEVEMPVESLPLNYYDLDLPIEYTGQVQTYHLNGCYTLSQSQPSLDITLNRPFKTRGIEFILNTEVSSNRQAQNMPFLEWQVWNHRGERQQGLLAVRPETLDWKNSRETMDFPVVHTWFKRIALTGRRAIPDAHRQFQAHLRSVLYTFKPPIDIKRFRLTLQQPDITVRVWRVRLLKVAR